MGLAKTKRQKSQARGWRDRDPAPAALAANALVRRVVAGNREADEGVVTHKLDSVLAEAEQRICNLVLMPARDLRGIDQPFELGPKCEFALYIPVKAAALIVWMTDVHDFA